MGRRNRVGSMIIIGLLIVCAVILFTALRQQKSISEDAVLVKYDVSFLENFEKERSE